MDRGAEEVTAEPPWPKLFSGVGPRWMQGEVFRTLSNWVSTKQLFFFFLTLKSPRVLHLRMVRELVALAPPFQTRL